MPDYDSGHAVQGGTAAEIMKQFFGPFSACSLNLLLGSRCIDASSVFRHHESFSQAADENAVSRILIGIHFRLAVEEGIKHGRKIANHAFNLFVKPVRRRRGTSRDCQQPP